MSATAKFTKSYLSTAVFVSRAYDALEEVSANDFRMRRGSGCKQLIEEIIPIAAFLKHLDCPGVRVKCRYYAGSQNYDAKVRLCGRHVDQGFFEREYFLEVTTATAKDEHLSREELTLTGFSFGPGNITREGSKAKGTYKIVSHPTVTDYDSPVTETSEQIKECLEKKSRKQYPQPCILLIQAEPDRPASVHEWSAIVRNINGSVNRESFAQTYIVNAWQNTVIRV